MNTITWDDFEKIEIRTGVIISAEPFPEARKPAYKLRIDFGEMGIKQTSAQITTLYAVDELVGMQITAVVNFPPKQIGPFMSEVLILGAIDNNGDVTLLTPSKKTKNGLRIG